MANLQNDFFPANFEIDSYFISTEGLLINYFKGEKEMHLLLTPQDACEMFKKTLVIEDFEMYKGEPVILWEGTEPVVDYHGNFHRRTGTAWMMWPDFVKDVKSWESYNGMTMQHIVQLHEGKNAISQLIGWVKSIGGTVTTN